MANTAAAGALLDSGDYHAVTDDAVAAAKLVALREEGVLVMGSGSAIHKTRAPVLPQPSLKKVP